MLRPEIPSLPPPTYLLEAETAVEQPDVEKRVAQPVEQPSAA